MRSTAPASTASCSRWPTVPGVVKSAEELPAPWGWMELEGERLKSRRDPVPRGPENPVQPIDRSFLAALMRRASETSDDLLRAASAKAAKEAADPEEFERRVQAEVTARVGGRTRLETIVDEFEQASGIDLRNGRSWNHGRELGLAARVLVDTSAVGPHGAVASVLGSLEHLASEMRKSMAALGIEPQPAKTQRRRA